MTGQSNPEQLEAGAGPSSGRAGFRIPTVWLVAGGGWIGRGIQVIAQLVAIRFLIEGIGTQGYGVFAVLASLNGWLLLSDISIGTSLQNYISERRAAGRDADDLIVTATLLSLAVTTAICALLLALGPILARLLLEDFTFLTPGQRTVAFYAIVIPGVGTALGTVAYRIWFAQHRGYLSNLLPAAGTMIGTAAVWLLTYGGGTSSDAVPGAIFVYYLPLAVLPTLALAGIFPSRLGDITDFAVI